MSLFHFISESKTNTTEDISSVPEVKEKFKTHLVIDDTDTVIRCEKCDKTFSSKSSLNRHNLIHMTKRFKCDTCDKEFTYKCNLDVHKLNHSGVRAFKCEECGKEFTQKCRLTSHKLIHSGVKAHACEICTKSFISKSALNRHRMTHSGIKRFKCEDCDREFNEKCNLEVHQLTHSGIKPFKCVICARMFSRKYTLNTHMSRHRRKGEMSRSDMSDDSYSYKKKTRHKRNPSNSDRSDRSDRSGNVTNNDSDTDKTRPYTHYDAQDTITFDCELKKDIENFLQLNDNMNDDDPFQINDPLANIDTNDPLGLNDFTFTEKHDCGAFSLRDDDLMLDERIADFGRSESGGFEIQRTMPLIMSDEDSDSDFG